MVHFLNQSISLGLITLCRAAAVAQFMFTYPIHLLYHSSVVLTPCVAALSGRTE